MNAPPETRCRTCGTVQASTVCSICKQAKSFHDFRDTPLTLKADRFALAPAYLDDAGLSRGRL